MRWLSVRLILSLIVGITLVSLAFSYNEVRLEKLALRKDLEQRAEVLGESLAGYIEPYLEKQSHRELQRIVDHFANREHLEGMAIYDKKGAVLAATPGLPNRLGEKPWLVTQAITTNQGSGQFARLGSASVHVYAYPLRQHDEAAGGLVIVHDASYINTQSVRMWRNAFAQRVGAGSPDCFHHGADRPLEHCGSDCEGGAMDEVAENGTRQDAVRATGSGVCCGLWRAKCKPSL